ncbi:hypothetical protein GRF59_05615 [Paenibacillus sp. HJL G12]|uniref:Uncharacterized protein n=1 Tax=Paenibacillus dendrobii TaxID=2691084 RepID=A0A7X3LFK8_9BACL|nr:hypothetical protein [Paenibacillus dendrobii]MWV43102.1 hypothetical protein [Paenibacillus dendrobii]
MREEQMNSTESDVDQVVEVNVEDLDGEVIEDFTQQLSINGQFIYNARNDGVILIVENLGFGDVYVSDKPYAKVGEESHRLVFKEQRAFQTDQLFFTSASQPVVSIIEVK